VYVFHILIPFFRAGVLQPWVRQGGPRDLGAALDKFTDLAYYLHMWEAVAFHLEL
jgi:hypothetical protein